ncbi:hypothetical protein GEMRC1_011780 [Eukaryota sp. GEM-RC1]
MTIPPLKQSRVVEDPDIPEELAIPSPIPAIPSTTPNLRLKRPNDVISLRENLPIINEEQPLIEAIRYHDVTLVVGPTGSGKSTQLPQFLYESGFSFTNLSLPGRIIVVQPRRLTAIALAKRVSYEMGLTLGQEVGYHVRFDQCFGDNTKILFVTDGILVQYLKSDILLTNASAVVVDEAHERSVNTDVALGLLSICVRGRLKMMTSATPSRDHKWTPFRLVIMSATLKTDDFCSPHLWSFPKIITIPSKVYPICVHFARTTMDDYVKSAFLKVSQIHNSLPNGTILVFVAGADECHRFGKESFKDNGLIGDFDLEDDDSFSDGDFELNLSDCDDDVIVDEEEVVFLNCDDSDFALNKLKSILETETKLITDSTVPPWTSVFKTPGVKKSRDDSPFAREQKPNIPIKAVPLYSSLPKHKQDLIFDLQSNSQSRLVIVSTNIAEASLTIPDVKYVVDTGRVKRKHFHPLTGASLFRVGLVSQSSSTQRTGRTGRTCPGHVFRLYSSAVYNDTMKKFEDPGILGCHVDGIVLMLKYLGVNDVSSFPWVTCPKEESVSKAERLLDLLGATKDGKCTKLGKLMMKFPVSPRFSKILIVGEQLKILGQAISGVASLSVDNLVCRTELNSELEPHSFGDFHFFVKLLDLWKATSNSEHDTLAIRLGINQHSMKMC